MVQRPEGNHSFSPHLVDAPVVGGYGLVTGLLMKHFFDYAGQTNTGGGLPEFVPPLILGVVAGGAALGNFGRDTGLAFRRFKENRTPQEAFFGHAKAAMATAVLGIGQFAGIETLFHNGLLSGAVTLGLALLNYRGYVRMDGAIKQNKKEERGDA